MDTPVSSAVTIAVVTHDTKNNAFPFLPFLGSSGMRAALLFYGELPGVFGYLF